MNGTEREVFHVKVDTGNEMTEVVVVDSRFEKVIEGIGTVEIGLPAGRYLVKTRIGEATGERFISVPEETQVTIAPPPPPIATPFANPAWSEGERRAETAFRAAAPAVEGGMGTLSLVVRDASHDITPIDDITLRSLDGSRIIRLGDEPRDADSQINSRGEVSGFAVRLRPGGYVLQVRAKHINTVGIGLWVSVGFDTRVQVERKPIASLANSGKRDRRRVADLVGAAIGMVRLGSDESDLSREGAAILDMARSTLAAERPIVPRSLVRGHLWTRYDSPMLGILCAHLLGLQEEPDLELLGEMVSSLRSIVPGHPDVQALGLLLGVSGESFGCPPMLRASWSILTQRAASSPSLIDPRSVAAAVGPYLTTARPWLIWNGSIKHLRPPIEKSREESTQRIDSALRNLDRAFDQRKSLAFESTTAGETGQVRVTGSKIAPALAEAYRDPSRPGNDAVAEIADRLQIPQVTVEAELEKLRFHEG